MSKEEVIAKQKVERAERLNLILESKSPKRLIVAGAGTGKTYTFGEILKLNPDGVNIAMTFIRLLRDDMEGVLGDWAEVRTFHEFCKKILHKTHGSVFLYPKLTEIIQADTFYLDMDLNDFDKKFQMLDETGEEIKFYIVRGDYYKTVSFNDSVFRVLKVLQQNPTILNKFDNILIDEYQDFNPLEVAFIDELTNFGNILLVGDDDQAVYASRGSSPEHLRDKYNSGEYDIFELPYCNRCPEAVVESAKSIFAVAKDLGFLQNRIEKDYICFIEAKDSENQKYPKIVTAKLSTAQTILKFIKKKISEISDDEISESWTDGKEYPTVLIIGTKPYLNFLNKQLKKDFPELRYKQTEKTEKSISDAYHFLVQNIKSNIGWRILIIFDFKDRDIKKMIEESNKGKDLCDILDNKYINKHTEIVSILSKFNKAGQDNEVLKNELKKLVNEEIFNELIESFIKVEEVETEKDKTKPSILLTSFQGCKGLSAGFVFIVGANNGVIPADICNILDVDICQFIVAMTRTRKCCYILSEDWMYGPQFVKGRISPKNQKCFFIEWIPPELLEDLGELKAKDIK